MPKQKIQFSVKELDDNPELPPVIDVYQENGWTIVVFNTGIRLKFK